MTLKEAAKLKPGDRVRWPEGANECTGTLGVVEMDTHTGNRYVVWDDAVQGERTFLHDQDAVKFIER